MGNKVTAVCLKQVFDSKACIHYLPGDTEANLDIESEVAIYFQLSAEDRKVARAAEQKRIQEREDEIAEMQKEGFDNLYDFRNYKKMIEYSKAGKDVEFLCDKCGKSFEKAEQLRGHKMTCKQNAVAQ